MFGKKTTKDLMKLRNRILTGSILGTLFWLAWPMIVANLVNTSYNIVDAYWLGKLGRQAFGAPTVSFPLIMLFYSIGMGFAMAGISLISQYIGAGDFKSANRSAGNLLAFMLSMSVVLSTLGILFSPYFLRLMHVPPDIYPYAVSYLNVIFAGIPISFIGFAFNTIANSLGDTRTPTVLNIASSITNMVLDPFLIYGLLGLPMLGVVGAAIATILSRVIVSAAGLKYLITGYHGLKITWSDLRIEKWWLKKVISIGTPMAIQRSSNSLGFTIMMSLVSMYGSAVVAAYGVATRVINIMSGFTWGLNRATSVMVGQNIGAEQYERAKKIAATTMTIIFIILSAGSALIYLFREPLVAFFISDPKVIAVGSEMISIFIWSLPFFGLFAIGGAIASGSGHTKFFATLSIIRLWALRIGLSYLLALWLAMGSDGIWIAMTISNIVVGIITVLWVLSGRWAKRVIELRSIPLQPE